MDYKFMRDENEFDKKKDSCRHVLVLKLMNILNFILKIILIKF